jgi:hypothetical protein
VAALAAVAKLAERLGVDRRLCREESLQIKGVAHPFELVQDRADATRRCPGDAPGGPGEGDMAEDPLARRRRQFPKLKGWHRNRSGNWQIEIRQFRVTMFENALGWGAAINHPSRPEGAFTPGRCGNFTEAQMAAFDLLVMLERQLGEP